MKNRTLLFSCLLLGLLASCGGDDPLTPEKEKPVVEVDPEIVEPVVPRNEAINDGRHVTAYVTYYGSLTPDAYIMTHINYAFAELYMVDGVYQGFKLQGKVSRFETVVAQKKSNPDLKICLSFTHGVSNSDNRQGGSFSALAKSDANRKAFAMQVIQAVAQTATSAINAYSSAAAVPLIGYILAPVAAASAVAAQGWIHGERKEGRGGRRRPQRGMGGFAGVAAISRSPPDNRGPGLCAANEHHRVVTRGGCVEDHRGSGRLRTVQADIAFRHGAVNKTGCTDADGSNKRRHERICQRHQAVEGTAG